MLISRKPEMQQSTIAASFNKRPGRNNTKWLRVLILKRSLIEPVSVKSKRKYFAFFSKLSYPASRLKLQHDLPGYCSTGPSYSEGGWRYWLDSDLSGG